jgi:hypothetical protein
MQKGIYKYTADFPICDTGNPRKREVKAQRAPSHTYNHIGRRPSSKPTELYRAARNLKMSLPMHLRTYRDKSKDEVTRDFFNVPHPEQLPGSQDPPSAAKLRNVKEVQVAQGMDINAVLSVEGKEEVYVCCDIW